MLQPKLIFVASSACSFSNLLKDVFAVRRTLRRKLGQIVTLFCFEPVLGPKFV